MSEDVGAAQSYHEATGEWPQGFENPPPPTEDEKRQKAAQAYYDATGHWPGQTPEKVEQKEAPEDKFSHYLRLANGNTVRFAIHPRRQEIPSEWNGVPVVQVHNSHAPVNGGEDE